VTVVKQATEAGGAMPPATVKVWDVALRVFHWTLAAAFVVAFASADDFEGLHMLSGYVVCGLLGWRILWGLVGPHHARFAAFVRPPRVVLGYLRDVARFRARRHLGHNPAGGAMVVALLAALAATGITGHLMTTEAFADADWMEDLHEVLATGTLGLAGLHVLGVLAASLLHGENLVKAMLTGRKRG
jgi:cytochrome b